MYYQAVNSTFLDVLLSVAEVVNYIVEGKHCVLYSFHINIEFLVLFREI